MGEYLSFDKLITPTLVRLVFWALVVLAIMVALGDMFGGAFWEGVAILFIGPLIARIYCEVVIVIFQINNTLTEIRDATLNRPSPPAVPPVS